MNSILRNYKKTSNVLMGSGLRFVISKLVLNYKVASLTRYFLFWEHQIRDKRNYTQRINYIHYNPVKHGYVKNVKAWPSSSFHNFVKLGLCEENCGNNEIIKFADTIGKEQLCWDR